ncbi:CGNR zinc finger domain-containing protein [Salinisphaera hydrothermalis]|uniref:CGNR zinc finger domain-containing protein n=1 Tax=Salinisphaera hydrothermalis TaxID=563188 RepID=UPI0033419C00
MGVEELPLVGEDPVLDFVNTVDDPGTSSERDYLTDYEQVVQMCCRTGLITDDLYARLAEAAMEDGPRASGVFDEVVILRDQLRSIFLSILGRPVSQDTGIVQLDRLAHEAHQHRVLDISIGQRSACLRWQATDNFVRVPLWAIAINAVDLLCNEDRMQRLKVCANDPCQWLFLDYSRNGKRRWCSMAECGQEAKIKRLRERRRSSRH